MSQFITLKLDENISTANDERKPEFQIIFLT